MVCLFIEVLILNHVVFNVKEYVVIQLLYKTFLYEWNKICYLRKYSIVS